MVNYNLPTSTRQTFVHKGLGIAVRDGNTCGGGLKLVPLMITLGFK